MWNNSHLIHQQSILHRKELIRQAERHRWSRLAATETAPRWSGVRNQLGDWLIWIGQRLRTQPASRAEWRGSRNMQAGL